MDTIFRYLDELIELVLPKKYKNRRWVKISIKTFLLIVVIILVLDATIDCFWSYLLPPSFDKKNSFNILVLKFKRIEHDKNKDLLYEEAIKENLDETANKDKLNVQVISDCRSIYPKDTSEALDIAKKYGADLIIYGNYYEASSRTDINYILNSKYNYIQSQSVSMENRYINSLADIRQGYLVNDINYITYWVFALKEYVNGDNLKAISYLNKIKVTDDAKKVRQLYFLGDLYTNSNLPKEAIKVYSQLLNMNINNSDVYLNRGVNFKKINEPLNAIKDYYSGLTIDPTNFLINYNLANNYEATGYIDSARYYINKSIQYKPNDVRSYIFRGVISESLNDKTNATTDYETAINIAPNSQETKYAYYNLGINLASENNFVLALKNFLKADSLGMEGFDLYYNIGYCYLCDTSVLRFPKAIAFFDKSLSINENFGFSIYYRAVAYSLSGSNYADSEHDRFFNMNFERADVLAFRGKLNVERHKYKEAILDFQKAITLDEKLREELNQKIIDSKKNLSKEDPNSSYYYFALPCVLSFR